MTRTQCPRSISIFTYQLTVLESELISLFEKSQQDDNQIIKKSIYNRDPKHYSLTEYIKAKLTVLVCFNENVLIKNVLT